MIRKLFAGAFALVAATCALSPSYAANLAVKDANSVTQALCEKTASDGSLVACHTLYDTTLTQIDPATKQYQITILTALGSPFQAGGLIGNTSFGISGLLPAFAATPTFNLGTLGGAATATAQAAQLAAMAPNVTYLGTTTPLTASATYTGATRDTGAPPGTGTAFSYFNASFYSDQAGTAYLDASNDGTTWYPVATSALAAATPLTLTTPVMYRYHRTRLVNSTTAETTLSINASYTAN